MKKLTIKKSKIHGKGLFVSENVKKGEFVQFIIGRVVKRENHTIKEALSIPNWYGISATTWIDPGNSIFRYLNHSCNPNLAITGTKKLVAMRDLKKDEEVTIDYSMTDADLLWEMKCNCKNKNCRKIIYSIQKVPALVVKTHYPLIPRYYLTLYKRLHPNVKL